MTMMTVTNIPCGAKLPVIALIAGFIMGDGCWWMAPLMYFAGIGLTIIYCIILKKTRAFAGEPAPFVMELPQYHIPSVKGVLLHVWERVWAFLKKAGTILFLCCAVMWFLSSFGIQDGAFGLVDTENSLLAVIGSAIAVIFAPLGFDTWQAVASSLSGFVAKEGIVSTMGVLANVSGDTEDAVNVAAGVASWFPSSIAAFTFLMFNLLDSPSLQHCYNGTADAVKKMVLVRNWIPVWSCLCCITLHLPDRNTDHNRSIRNRYCSSISYL